jgi:SH3-like domain-containing protein
MTALKLGSGNTVSRTAAQPLSNAQPSQSTQMTHFIAVMQARRQTGKGFPARLKHPAALLGAALLALSAAHTACALDFSSITAPAVFFDAPSTKAKPLFVMRTGTPVERVVGVEGWVKVRDAEGTLAWVEKKYLGDQRQVIVTAALAQIRASADEQAPVVFEAARDVLLELQPAGGTSQASAQTATKTGNEKNTRPGTPPDGWLKVKHRDGQQGFVKASQVWGW